MCVCVCVCVCVCACVCFFYIKRIHLPLWRHYKFISSRDDHRQSLFGGGGGCATFDDVPHDLE